MTKTGDQKIWQGTSEKFVWNRQECCAAEVIKKFRWWSTSGPASAFYGHGLGTGTVRMQTVAEFFLPCNWCHSLYIPRYITAGWTCDTADSLWTQQWHVDSSFCDECTAGPAAVGADWSIRGHDSLSSCGRRSRDQVLLGIGMEQWPWARTQCLL